MLVGLSGKAGLAPTHRKEMARQNPGWLRPVRNGPQGLGVRGFRDLGVRLVYFMKVVISQAPSI